MRKIFLVALMALAFTPMTMAQNLPVQNSQIGAVTMTTN